MRIRIEKPDFIDQGHKYDTILLIERVVEYAEEQNVPFTVSQAWRMCYGHYSMVGRILISMRKAGLLIQTNPGHQPKRWLSADKVKEGT